MLYNLQSYSAHVWGFVRSALFRAASQALECLFRLKAQILESGKNMSQAGVCTGLCLPQFSGTWYTKAMVSDKDHPEGKGPKKVFPIRVTALEGGDLELMITFL